MPCAGARRKAGVTLVEVMLAGAMVSLATLAVLEGFVVAAKITRENAAALAADNIAFDLLWRKFHGDYEQLLPLAGQVAPQKNTDDPDSPYRSTSNILGNPPQYSYRETVALQNQSNPNDGLRLSIDLSYGPDNQWTRHLEVLRSDIPRTAD